MNMNNNMAHILLVEDDSVNQLVASLILRQQGMTVTIANNGVEALARICSKAFQLVLMDIQMPIMDGYEAAARIRAMSDPYFKAIPIIAFTASAIAEVQHLVAQNGMNDLINKPLDMDEFQRKMDKYMHTLHRPLSIDFNLYTNGDPDFKQELISHMIENVKEVQRALPDFDRNTSVNFIKVHHKVKATVAMLNDAEFTEMLEEIKSFIVSSQPIEFFKRKLKLLSHICDQLIASLVAESNAGFGDITSRSGHS